MIQKDEIIIGCEWFLIPEPEKQELFDQVRAVTKSGFFSIPLESVEVRNFEYAVRD